jgi:hypothetical protein
MLASNKLIESRNRNIAAGIGSLLSAVIILDILFRDHMDQFAQVLGPAAFGLSAVNVIRCWTGAAKVDSALVARASSIEDRLDELERLKRRDMVTPEEYAAKRQEILKDL